MKAQIKKIIVLKIKEAEVIESQLSSDDLRVFNTQAKAPEVKEKLATGCPDVYCVGGYCEDTCSGVSPAVELSVERHPLL